MYNSNKFAFSSLSATLWTDELYWCKMSENCWKQYWSVINELQVFSKQFKGASEAKNISREINRKSYIFFSFGNVLFCLQIANLINQFEMNHKSFSNIITVGHERPDWHPQCYQISFVSILLVPIWRDI